MNGLRIGPMRPDEISIAVNWAAAEGWNPGFADDACFAAVDPEGFLNPAVTVGAGIRHHNLGAQLMVSSGSGQWP